MMTAWTWEFAEKVVNTWSDSGFILKVRTDRTCWQIESRDEREKEKTRMTSGFLVWTPERKGLLLTEEDCKGWGEWKGRSHTQETYYTSGRQKDI